MFNYFSIFFLGLDAELYYVRNDLISHYALSFNLLVPSETNFLHFTWHAKSKVRAAGGQLDRDLPLRMGLPLHRFDDDPAVMEKP